MNVGRMYLGGGGDSQQAFSVERDFFSSLKDNPKVLYLPIALRRQNIGYEACYDWFAALTASHAQDWDVDFTMLLEKDRVPDLHAFGGIYVGGGNTYHLLKYLNESGFGEKIPGFVSEGGRYFGGSAGAMILGADIRTAEEENDQAHTRHVGLNLLGGKSVLCHFSEARMETAQKMSEHIGTDVIAIPEDSGVVYESGIPHVIGKAYLINPKGGVKL